MEKLIILALLALGSAISSYIQNKKKREEEEAQKHTPTPARPTLGEPPVPHWPKTGRDWQDELRRVLEGRTEPPVVQQRPQTPSIPPPTPTRRAVPQTSMRPVATPQFPNPLTQSTRAYTRAAELPGRVETRLEAVERDTERARPSAPARRVPTPGSVTMRRWTRNRQSLREAFVASLIFAPPVALRDSSSVIPYTI